MEDSIDENRIVGAESQKSFKHKVKTGFFKKYMDGYGVEVGCNTPNTILPNCIPIGMGSQGYDGLHIPAEDATFDYLYTSHCLEHIEDWLSTLQEWFRVIKRKGHLVIVVPHQYLYEKKEEMPSRFSGEHVRFYTPSKLLYQIELALKPNTYRIRHMQDNDEGFNYWLMPEQHSVGQYEIELVIEKL